MRLPEPGEFQEEEPGQAQVQQAQAALEAQEPELPGRGPQELELFQWAPLGQEQLGQ